MKNIYKIYSVVVLTFMFGCNDDFLERYPTTEITEQNFFQSAGDLRLYTNGFYETLNPPHSLGYGADYESDDMETGNDELSVLEQGRVIPSTILGADGWDWESLRSINYFLEHYNNEEIPVESRQHYAGIARFFRAWFYFDKVKTFGDVPWVNKVLEDGDEALMGERDSRTLVMDSILSDLNYAINNINLDEGYNRINSNSALALKSRVALFEGSWQKYHNADQSRSNVLFNEAKSAAKELIESGAYAIHNTGNSDEDYLNVFASEEALDDESILVRTYIEGEGSGHSSNYIFNDYNQGRRQATKSFIDSFLMNDGSAFSNQSNSQNLPYSEEILNRDPRLSQIIRTPGYKRLNEDLELLPDLTYAATGYQIIKYVTGPEDDSYVANTNDYILIRYAEVLLNYAEAVAELGELGQQDLDISINKLRSRAGLPNLLLNAALDPFQSALYPNVTDPMLLEIRRERRVELCFEGFRLDDVRRWKVGQLIRNEYQGMYIEMVGKAFDMNNDGNNDAIVLNNQADYDDTTMNGLQRIILGEDSPNGGKAIELSSGNSGNIILHADVRPVFQDYEYLYPIPTPELLLNPNLVQNEGY
ncbi:SusD-like protein [Formosa agariphila KMM 3901]|uniref:SusD-like protein n=1 Tax=Formosa agariphila (strain DSM 15362 / KCTC 12365 / LMG 23005 / KMM 3901 / M-2Alg 35-1) TaxID=1347342 RepID=T2KQR4_FORAG|nr:RagB/SusD family nutrient uptake outer membrane protein [Formosa agariphila]CDF80791.1 SusD-like protein [Formosa agariphila KMM 3901]